LVMLLLAFPALSVAGVAGADEGQYADFYTPPNMLAPGRAGDLMRSEPSRLALEPSGQLGAYESTGTRIMYRSNNTHDQPDAVTGTYFEPDNPWPDQGPHPLIALAVGTYSQGDPSELGQREPLKSLFAEQRIRRYRPAAPAFIDQNRFDSVVPWVPSHQLALDWCALGADVQFFHQRAAAVPQQAGRQPRAGPTCGRRARSATDRGPV
jgi:hypothetical protein